MHVKIVIMIPPLLLCLYIIIIYFPDIWPNFIFTGYSTKLYIYRIFCCIMYLPDIWPNYTFAGYLTKLNIYRIYIRPNYTFTGYFATLCIIIIYLTVNRRNFSFAGYSAKSITGETIFRPTDICFNRIFFKFHKRFCLFVCFDRLLIEFSYLTTKSLLKYTHLNR